MLPYYLLVFSPIFFSLFKVKGVDIEKHKKRIITFFFVILLALLMLRAPTVGRDLENYRYIFESNVRTDWQEIGDLFSEPAWSVFNKLIGSLTSKYQWFLIASALVTVIPVWYTYRKEIEYPVLTISIFVTMSTFVLLFSGLRQSVAISLGIIAFEFTKKHKFIPYLLIVFLAFLFHRSAFMLLFMYPIYHARITRKWLWFVVPIMSLIFIFNKLVFKFLIVFIAEFYDGDTLETGAYTMLILFVIFSVFSFVIPDEKNLDADTIGMRNFLLLATLIQLFAPLNSLAMRMGYYYIIFIPILIPKIIKASSIKWKQVAELSKYIMVVFFIAYFFITAPKANLLDTFPYHFFWENIV